jgi:hypothetical protein
MVHIQVALDSHLRQGSRIGAAVGGVFPQIIARAVAGHIGIAQAGHHGTEVLNVFNILARQVWEKRLFLWWIVMHVTVNQVDTVGRVRRWGGGFSNGR